MSRALFDGPCHTIRRFAMLDGISFPQYQMNEQISLNLFKLAAHRRNKFKLLRFLLTCHHARDNAVCCNNRNSTTQVRENNLSILFRLAEMLREPLEYLRFIGFCFIEMDLAIFLLLYSNERQIKCVSFEGEEISLQ